ncbi:MAG: uncharacterized protein PWR01_3379 [Clostridiales bacterium]|jgi:uncharacterized Fe-S center protein|nr:uncharacterized protein [Clostridiales bacterium]MDN5282306.1 uncharacterized protein [Candidatus Ozemobacter sp.]
MTEKAKVFTVGLRATKPQDSQVAKIEKLARAIGIDKFAWDKKLVAVKTHFGERGNAAFPRPVLIRPVVDLIKNGGGKPFLAETTTLYTGSRSNAVEHTETAIRHGFGIEVTGAPIFMCDGLTGRDGHMVKIDGTHYQEVSVASGIQEADALVVVSHFKGHELTSFGGAIKNLGMGCCSRSAKLAMHTTIRPTVLASKCVKCGICFDWCSAGAISQPKPDGPVVINPNLCRGCGECLISCRNSAIRINWSDDAQGVTERMVEHAYGVAKTKPGSAFYISFLMNIVPLCDCVNFSGAPVVPDIGFAASTDPVALDACCLDMVNQQIGLVGSALKEAHEPGKSKFCDLHPDLKTELQLEYAEKIGLGTRKYERINLEQ